MPRIHANGIELEYEVMGTGEPMVLIMGIGAQLIAWPDGLCKQLVDRGFQVIRFDNRDVGLSSKLEGAPITKVSTLLWRALLGLPVDAAYSLVDMADDIAGLLDALELPDAHIVGASMGGMIAQTMAIVHPSRVRTLTSIMSHPGDRLSSLSQPKALRALLGKAPRNRDEAIDRYLTFHRVAGSKGFEVDVDYLRDLAGRAYDRCHYPRGFMRQLAAIAATGDRTRALRFVRAPTLVLHGSDDPLIRPVGGRATARAIPGAELQIIDGMGHDLPRGTWPIISGAIARHVELAGATRDRAPVRPATHTATAGGSR